jgi:hypothetical protein
MDVLLSAVVLGAASAALVCIVRALPGVEPLIRRGLKPFACNLCMAWWSVLLLGAADLILDLTAGFPLSWLGGMAVSLLLLRVLSEPLHDFDPPPPWGDEP